jgi:hypothetical protein
MIPAALNTSKETIQEAERVGRVRKSLLSRGGNHQVALGALSVQRINRVRNSSQNYCSDDKKTFKHILQRLRCKPSESEGPAFRLFTIQHHSSFSAMSTKTTALETTITPSMSSSHAVMENLLLNTMREEMASGPASKVGTCTGT